MFEELKVTREVLTIELKSSFFLLSSLKTFSCFSNACCTTYRIISTIHVITFTKKSLLKLKMLKSYLWNIMSQGSLSSFTLIFMKRDVKKSWL